MDKKKKVGRYFINLCVVISILLIAYCVIYIFNYYTTNDILLHYPRNSKSGLKDHSLTPNEIGDSIGGVLNPLIGLIASILTFLAFYMQKRANDDIQAQFKVQQFEGQFYEMLRLHKENVNEIEINIGDSVVKGRATFKYAVDEIEQLLQRIQPTYPVSNGGAPNPFLSDDEIFPTKFYVAYNVFFWGSMNFGQFQIGNSIVGFANTQSINNSIQWHSYLGHYYRHLFSMVKFVVNSKSVKSYKDKMRYLKILRAQLSNYEQIMLFYNWLCDEYGGTWENEKNHFFTEYKMIHNLWVKQLIPNQFFVDNVNYLIKEYNKRKKKTPLFEFQQGDFNKMWNL